MMNKKRGLLVLCMILLLGSLVSAIPQTFSVHGKLENNAGSPLEGTYNMSFNIYTTYTGGSASWTLSNQDVTTDSNGIYNIVLTNVNLNFSTQYYLGVAVGNDSEMSPRINLTSSPYAFEAQNVSVSGVRFNSNVDFGTDYNFTFDSGTLFVDGSKGYVGIGTTSPQAIFHIQTTGTGNKTGLIVGRNTANTNDISSIVFNSADLGDQGAIDSIILSGSTADLAFRTRTASALTEKVRITTTGYVGIGTTTPQSKLEVKDTAPFITINGTGANSEPGLKIQNDARGWQFYVAGGDADKLYIRDTTVPATRMVIDDSGYVGIGTTTPQQKLDVVGNINSTGFINATTDLCIQGGACLSSVSASAGGWTKTGTQVALTTATDNVSIGSTDFLVHNSKGYVGIGTTSPEGRLEVSNLDTDTANTLLIRKPTEATGTDVGGLRFVTGSGAISSSNAIAGIEADITQANPSSLKGELTFSTNRGDSYTEAMRIDDSGYVGIGTTTPATPLDIDTGSNSLGLRLRGLAETVEIGDMYMGTNGEMIISTVGGSGGQAFIDLRSEDDNYGLILRQSNGTGISPYANFYVTDAATDYLNIVVNVAQGTKGLVIDENENVGIGTTTPQQKLHVNGNILANGTINATSDVCIQGGACLSSAGTGSGTISGSGTSNYVPLWNGTSSINNSNIYQGASGNIGIGTTGPTSKLGVKDTATDGALTSTLRLWQEGSGSGTGASIELGFADNSLSSASIGGFYDGAGRGLSFNTALSGVALSEKMRITSAGYVGIGTTTPQQKLHVNGSILANGTINATTDLCIQGGACLSSVSASAGGWTKTGTQVALTTATDNVSIGSTDFFVDNSKGYVGIGTTSPTQLLHVNGGIIEAGDTTSTLGSTILVGAYNGPTNDYVNTIGGHYSSGGTVIGFAIKPLSGSAGYASSADNVAWKRAAINLDNTGIHFLANSTSTTIAPGSAVNLNEFMTVLNTGNVGIGTSTPTKKFEVNGTAGAFNVDPNNAGGPLLNTTSGNVTITSAGGSVIIRLG